MDSSTISDWLADLAAKTPTPGGGAVAALLAALTAAQLGMVAIYTTGPKWQDRETHMKQLSDELEELRTKALLLVQADAEAFKGVGTAYGLPKDSAEQKSERQQAIQKALTTAAEPPCQVVKLASRLVEIAEEIVEAGNPNIISDVAVAATTARAALESAIANIVVNQVAISDVTVKQSLDHTVTEAEKQITATAQVIKSVLNKIKAS